MSGFLGSNTLGSLTLGEATPPVLNTIEECFRFLLSKVCPRVYRRRRPPDSNLPAVVYELTDATPLVATTGKVVATKTTFTVSLVGPDLSALLALEARFRSEIVGFYGGVAGLQIDFIGVGRWSDGEEPLDDDGSESNTNFVRTSEFQVGWQEMS